VSSLAGYITDSSSLVFNSTHLLNVIKDKDVDVELLRNNQLGKQLATILHGYAIATIFEYINKNFHRKSQNPFLNLQ